MVGRRARRRRADRFWFARVRDPGLAPLSGQQTASRRIWVGASAHRHEIGPARYRPVRRHPRRSDAADRSSRANLARYVDPRFDARQMGWWGVAGLVTGPAEALLDDFSEMQLRYKRRGRPRQTRRVPARRARWRRTHLSRLIGKSQRHHDPNHDHPRQGREPGYSENSSAARRGRKSKPKPVPNRRSPASP